MLSFKDFVVLIESRLDFLSNQHQGISTAHDPEAVHTDAKSIVNHFATHADPTTKKTNTGWIMNQYKTGKIKQSDAPNIKNTLASFEKHKAKLESKDLNQYKSVSDVEKAVAPHASKESDAGREKIFDNGDKQVYKLNTKEASQKIYGGGANIGGDHTDWCTADRRNDMNAFDRYAKNGPLHTIHIKGDPNSPYQHHTSMMTDRNDHSVNPHEFVGRNPDLADTLAKIHPNLASNSKHIDAWMRNSDPDLRGAAMRNPHHNASHVDAGMKDSDLLVRMSALKSPHHNESHVDAGMKDSSGEVRELALKSPHANASHIDTVMKDSSPVIRETALKSPAHNASHVDAGMKDSDPWVKQAALMSPHANASHVDMGMKDSDPDVRWRAISSPHHNASHVDTAMKDSDSYVKIAALHSPHANASHFEMGTKDSNALVRLTAERKIKEKKENDDIYKELTSQ